MPSNIPHGVLRRKAPDGRTFKEHLVETNAGYWIDDQHWLHGPGVRSRPVLPESNHPTLGGQPFIVPRSCIAHTNAGGHSASSLWSWITRADVTGEPHFHVGYDDLEQYMPFNQRADCNYSANRWLGANGQWYGAISFECQDDGAATVETTPFKLGQMGRMIHAMVALCVCYGISCTVPATWDDSGIGHHTLFPFQGVGSKAWTNVRGKTCPGAARKRQMDALRNEVAKELAEFGGRTGWKCGNK